MLQTSESNMPDEAYSNQQDANLFAFDVKDIEDPPSDEVESFDFSGPLNSGYSEEVATQNLQSVYSSMNAGSGTLSKNTADNGTILFLTVGSSLDANEYDSQLTVTKDKKGNAITVLPTTAGAINFVDIDLLTKGKDLKGTQKALGAVHKFYDDFYDIFNVATNGGQVQNLSQSNNFVGSYDAAVTIKNKNSVYTPTEQDKEITVDGKKWKIRPIVVNQHESNTTSNRGSGTPIMTSSLSEATTFLYGLNKSDNEVALTHSGISYTALERTNFALIRNKSTVSEDGLLYYRLNYPQSMQEVPSFEQEITKKFTTLPTLNKMYYAWTIGVRGGNPVPTGIDFPSECSFEFHDIFYKNSKFATQALLLQNKLIGELSSRYSASACNITATEGGYNYLDVMALAKLKKADLIVILCKGENKGIHVSFYQGGVSFSVKSFTSDDPDSFKTLLATYNSGKAAGEQVSVEWEDNGSDALLKNYANLFATGNVMKIEIDNDSISDETKISNIVSAFNAMIQKNINSGL